MTIIDMHPDDLLDRELSGTLSPADQRRLLEHLAQCSSCRLERQLRDDFAGELAATRAPDALQTFVTGALRAALPANGTTPVALQAPALPPARRSSRRRAALLATALVIASGAAAAQAGLVDDMAQFARQQLAKVMGEPAPRTSAAASAPRPSSARPPSDAPAAADTAQGAALAAPTLAAPTPSELAPAPVPSAAVASGHKSKPRAQRSARRVRRESAARKSPAVAAAALTADVAMPSRADVAQASVSAPAPALAADVPSVSAGDNAARATRGEAASAARVDNASSASTPQPDPQPSADTSASSALGDDGPSVMTAASLFHRANGARHEGQGGEALRLYALLRSEFPGSAEARLSLALAARMQLDFGRLDAAVAGFDAYLATRDRSLREQALAGRALALGRLGRSSAEQSAWRDLLLDYPDSSYVAYATQRLRQDER
jgi:putative zinc finger protein